MPEPKQAQAHRGTFYDTMNTTFYTQTESYYDKDFGANKLNIVEDETIKNLKHREAISYERQMQEKVDNDKLLLRKEQDCRKGVKLALDHIEHNPRAKSLLLRALEGITYTERRKAAEDVQSYQQKVKKRLFDKKKHEEHKTHVNVQYMASMLPTAMEMHQFIKVMKKDEIFENQNKGFKIVSQIRSHRDKERLEYLLSTNLSAH